MLPDARVFVAYGDGAAVYGCIVHAEAAPAVQKGQLPLCDAGDPCNLRQGVSAYIAGSFSVFGGGCEEDRT